MTTAAPTLIRDPWQRLWHWMTSDAWLALSLSVLVVLLGLSSFLPQTPQNDPVAYSRWLSETQQRFGTLTTPLSDLGLFAITRSAIFRVSAAWLGLICALRLIDRLSWLRRAPDRPLHPALDQHLPIERAALIDQLTGYQIRPNAEWLVAEKQRRLATLMSVLVYAGTLIVLIGLVVGTLVDFRADGVVAEQGTLTPIAGTPYTVRLDTLTDGRATLSLLHDTETVGQGTSADRQPWVTPDLSIYLEAVGPALIVSAVDQSNHTLGLQSTIDSPAQPEKTVSFPPDRSESFLAVPDKNIVLQVTRLPEGGFVAQALQSASGKVLAKSDIAPGDKFTTNDVTFAFREAAFVGVAVVSQPSHWLIGLGGLMAIAGLLGGAIWPVRRLWLLAVETQTRVISDEVDVEFATPSEPTTNEIPSTPSSVTLTPRRRALGSIVIGAAWLVWTIGLIVQIVLNYPHAALLSEASFKFNAAYGVWLGLSGALLIQRRWRLAVLIFSVAGAVFMLV